MIPTTYYHMSSLDQTRGRMSNKTYHDDDSVEQQRDGEDQRYKHALGIKVLEVRKGPATEKNSQNLVY